MVTFFFSPDISVILISNTRCGDTQLERLNNDDQQSTPHRESDNYMLVEDRILLFIKQHQP